MTHQWISIFLVASLCSCTLMSQERSVDQEIAQADILNFMSMHETKISNGEYHLSMSIGIASTPDSPAFFDCIASYEVLYSKSRKIHWHKIQKKTDVLDNSSELDLVVSPCQSEQLILADDRFFRLGGKWVIRKDIDTGFFFTSCRFPGIFRWPFLSPSGLHESVSVKPSSSHPLEKWDCISARMANGKRHAMFAHRDGGYGLIEFEFADGLPVLYKITTHAEKMVAGKIPRGGRVISKVETKWEELDGQKLPVKVAAVLSEANRTFLVDVSYKWRLGDKIPREALEYVMSAKQKD